MEISASGLSTKIQYFCIKRWRAAYLSIPKNACTSIKFTMACLKHADIENRVDDISDIHFHAGSYFDEIFNQCEGLPKDYFSFTFVRNPYERFLSFYKGKIFFSWDKTNEKYMHSHGFRRKMKMKQCLERISEIHPDEMDPHFAPQNLFVFKKGKTTVDFMGKLDNFKKDWRCLETKIGTGLKVFRFNVHDEMPGISPDSDVVDLINRIYEKDFELLGYHRTQSAKEKS